MNKFDFHPEAVAKQVEQLTLHTHGRMDANETAAFTRQLEYIFTELYDVQYQDIKWRDFLPTETRVPTWADSYTYRSFDKFGEAKFLTTYGPNDFPNVDLQGKESTQKVKALGNMFGYNVQELRQASRMNISLDVERAKAAREFLERKLDTVAAVGDVNTNLFGLAATDLSGGASTGIQSVTTSSSSHYWVNDGTHTQKTATEAVQDVNDLCNKVFNSSSGKFAPDTLVLDTVSYSWAATTPVALSFASDMTVLKYILASSPFIKNIDFWPQLNTAGASSKARVLCYKKDPRIFSMIMPQEFEQFPPQLEGLLFKVYCHARTGGVEVRYPQGVSYMDGLQP